MKRFQAVAVVMILLLASVALFAAPAYRLVADQNQAGFSAVDGSVYLRAGASSAWSLKGNLLPSSTAAYDLGSSSVKWANLYTNALKITEATNGSAGVATLNGSGWVTVANTSVGTGTRIMVSGQSTTGAPYVKSRVNNTSFSIYSTDSSDSGVVYWEFR